MSPSSLALSARKVETQFDHGATTCDSTTGSKTNSMNGKIQSNLHKRKFSSNSDVQKPATPTTITTNTRVLVEPIPMLNLSHKFVIQSVSNEALKENQSLTRDARLNQRKLQLRRQMYQLKGGIQHSRVIERSKLRFRRAMKLLKVFERRRKEM